MIRVILAVAYLHQELLQFRRRLLQIYNLQVHPYWAQAELKRKYHYQIICKNPNQTTKTNYLYYMDPTCNPLSHPLNHYYPTTTNSNKLTHLYIVVYSQKVYPNNLVGTGSGSCRRCRFESIFLVLSVFAFRFCKNRLISMLNIFHSLSIIELIPSFLNNFRYSLYWFITSEWTTGQISLNSN